MLRVKKCACRSGRLACQMIVMETKLKNLNRTTQTLTTETSMDVFCLFTRTLCSELDLLRLPRHVEVHVEVCPETHDRDCIINIDVKAASQSNPDDATDHMFSLRNCPFPLHNCIIFQ